jgi:NADH-quinone oxidoreductase subunit G
VTLRGPATEVARVTDVPMYQTDALVRRAPSLQRTREGRASAMTY